MTKDITVVAVDLAKEIFQIAYGDGGGRVLRRQRLGSRLAFAREMGLWRDVKQSAAATQLQPISGIGRLTASALTASAVDASHFKN